MNHQRTYLRLTDIGELKIRSIVEYRYSSLPTNDRSGENIHCLKSNVLCSQDVRSRFILTSHSKK